MMWVFQGNLLAESIDSSTFFQLPKNPAQTTLRAGEFNKPYNIFNGV
jgi:hypothetical protein